MKGTTKRILEALAETALSTTDIFIAITTSGYGASYNKVIRNAEKAAEQRRQLADKKRELQRYYAILYRLKKQNLVKENGLGKLEIARAGITKLKELHNKVGITISPHRYEKKLSNTFTIVAFDVPEQERKKRDWLRRTLATLGLQMIQRSLWLGKIKIPEEFIRDLGRLKMLSYVEIFEITKSGTLRHVE